MSYISHNPCFSGQCFAIKEAIKGVLEIKSHNPCFSGQCFAIVTVDEKMKVDAEVTILVLVDNVLQ